MLAVLIQSPVKLRGNRQAGCTTSDLTKKISKKKSKKHFKHFLKVRNSQNKTNIKHKT